ncbi:MAG: class I SAM-dependent methyltransferase [Acidimicrobiia bacterium]
MNWLHQRYCVSEKWREEMVGQTLPWVLEDVELDGPVLEIGPGPGLVTEALVRLGVADLTTLEIEPEAAEGLRRRYGTQVRVEVGDAAAMPFSNASFGTVLCCTMLHHVPTREAQDRVLTESRRVLWPDGVLAGSDSRTSLGFRMFHVFDVHNPVDPQNFPERLTAAGFSDVSVDPVEDRFRFRAVAL